MNLIAALMGQPDQRRLILARLNASAATAAKQRELHNLLYAYWANQGLYSWLLQNRYEAGINHPSIHGIRTPCARIVDFYVSHLWPGDLDEAFPIDTEHENILEPIREIWTWSNWEAEKDLAAQWLALYGDLFIRVAQPDDQQQVYFELIQPQYVSDFTEERGFVKSIRLDIPVTETVNGQEFTRTHTETWSKADQVYRQWRHEHGVDAKLEDLGKPTEEVSFAELSIDFVPFVHAKFKDVGDQWGMGCFTHLLDKVDELNLKATRHSEIMFNHLGVTWSLESDVLDAAGRPLPGFVLDPEVDGVVSIGGGRFFRPPSGAHLKEMVPDINYAAYLETIESEERALASDAPEMLWSRLSESQELSGRALRFLLGPAVKRCERARGNAERAFIRAAQMALTIGKNAGLFAGIGDYEAGKFDHTFEKRDVLPVDTLEEAQIKKTKAEAALLLKQLGWTDAAIQKDEFSLTDEEIEEMAAEKETTEEDAADAVLAALERQQPVPGQGRPNQPMRGRRNGAVPQPVA